MPNPLHSPEYAIFRRLLVQARLNAGLTQVEVAAKLRKPQSFVSKLERGERRLDVPEFVQLADVLGIEAAGFIETLHSEIQSLQKRILPSP